MAGGFAAAGGAAAGARGLGAPSGDKPPVVGGGGSLGAGGGAVVIVLSCGGGGIVGLENMLDPAAPAAAPFVALPLACALPLLRGFVTGFGKPDGGPWSLGGSGSRGF